MITEMKEKPPYVRFMVKAVEDRDASIEAGRYVSRDVEYALITPRGSKDCIEAEVQDYFARLKGSVQQGRFQQEWLNDILATYRAWKEGQDIPEKGTSLKNWPLLGPSQLNTLLGINIRTVEELAEANEETISRIGMGGRALAMKAAEWCRASVAGKPAEEVASLRLALESSNGKIQEMADALREAKHQIDLLKAKE